MKELTVDINCDVGEGIGNEKELFPYISSCNVACGGHAGDAETMTAIVRLALRHGVKLGAHPSYPDTKNFGRVSIQLPKKKLIRSIRQQLAAFTSVLKAEFATLHHIKPHGALYNDIAGDGDLARTFLEAVDDFRGHTILYVPYGSVIEKEAADQGFQVAKEAFGDRNYNDDLSLVSRALPNALIEMPSKVLQHITSIVRDQKVITITGIPVAVVADTLCIHGDTPTALEILVYLSSELPRQHIHIKK